MMHYLMSSISKSVHNIKLNICGKCGIFKTTVNILSTLCFAGSIIVRDTELSFRKTKKEHHRKMATQLDCIRETVKANIPTK